jgi:uncharacterized protein YfaP (DUF2135 family)
MITCAVLGLACAGGAPPSTPPSDPGTAQLPIEWSAGQQERLVPIRAALSANAEMPEQGALLVRLAFDDVADLDLFVTDPQQESVYFANSPSRSGGRLLADRRCSDSAPRVESVYFARPIAGRYRVGVDFHGRCDASSHSRSERKQGLYVVQIDHGGRTERREGMVAPGKFEVIVLEFDIGNDAANKPAD